MNASREFLNRLKFIDLRKDEPLSKHSTMRVGGIADTFAKIENEKQLSKFVNIYKDFKDKIKLLVIGEGSNTLFTDDFEGIVLKIMHKGIEIVEEGNEFVTLKVQAGHNWHEFVEYCVNNNLSGNENLAFIPGTVGAAPVQNIAAYGQVQEDTFVSLEAYNLKTGIKEQFYKSKCNFLYRSSIFKTTKKGKYIISSVTYKLKKAFDYIPETSYYSRYESLIQVLEQIAQKPYTLRDVFNATIEIRKRKLPDIQQVGTLGSFFINPFVTKNQLIELQNKFPGIQYYPVQKMSYPNLGDPIFKNQNIVKIPAAWLIEELGWKGKRKKNVAVSKKHSLCLTVIGPALGTDVLSLMKDIQESVKEKTKLELKTEINIV